MTPTEIKELCNEAERSEQARAARVWSEERLITPCNPLVTLPVSVVYALVDCVEAAEEVIRLDFSADAACDCMRCVAWRRLDAAYDKIKERQK